ncbi:MAG: response regulator [Prevotella sp.]|nr:response regulator [Prevotella sp.]
MKKALYIFALLALPVLSAAAADYRFHSIDVRQGLSSSTVNTMLVDSRGMLWIGTSMGLNRYDGYEVRPFRYFDAERKHPAISVDRLMEDGGGNIWIAYNGQTARYDMARQSFALDGREYFTKLGIMLPAKYQFAVSDKGNLWFVADGQIIHYDYASHRRQQWKTRLALAGKTWNFADCAEGLYLCDEHEVWRFIAKTGSVQRIPLPQDMLAPGNRLRVYVDSENTLWVYSTVNEGIWHYGGAQPMIARHGGSNAIRGIYDDGKGNVWVATDHNGVFVCSKADGSSIHMRNVRGDLSSIASDNVTCITADASGAIFLGHFKNGVSVSNSHSTLFQNCGQSLGDISTMLFSRGGDLWLGTDGHGVFVKPKGGTEQKLPFPDITISSFVESSDGTVWVGTYSGGIYKMRGTTVDKVFTHENGSLPGNSAWQMAEDNHHNLWVVSGFLPPYKLSMESGRTATVKAGGKTVAGLSLAFDGRHTMYVGTYNGIWAFDTNTGKSQFLLGNRKGTQQLLNSAVVSLCYDRRRDALWMAHTTGVSMFDIKRDELYYFNEQNGLFDSYVKTIVQDKQGNMWLSTSHGISCIQAQKDGGYVVHNFSDRVGVQNSYFNTFAAACSPDGDILFGGAEGYTLISPSAMYANKQRPQLRLVEVTRSGEASSMAVNVHVEMDDEGGVEPVQLSYDDRQITLRFFTGDLSSDGRVLYAYRVRGLSNDWTYTTKNKIEFFSLPHGTYTLEVKAADESGEWGEVLCVKLRVAPPFYLAWWMQILYFLLAAVAVYAGYRMVHRRHRRRIEEQRRKMEQAQQVQLSEMKLRFFTNISHDLRTPLTLIISPLQSILEELKGKDAKAGDNGVVASLRSRLEMIYRNARLLYNQVNMLLDFRRLDVGAESLKLQSIDVAQYVGNICQSFHDYASERNISFAYEPSAEHVFFTVDAAKLNKIMYNLLSNAFKFTPDGENITVSLKNAQPSASDSRLVISVADTGCGISDDDKERIFQRFYQVRTDDPKAGSGIGLHIVNEYARMHGGAVAVTDNQPQGSVFTVTLPQSEATAVSEETAAVSKEDSVAAPPHTDMTGDEATSATTILVVDDNRDLRTYIADSLRQAYKGKGYSIITAADGQEALEQLGSNDVTLVVTDIMMPRIDGMELTRRIKTNIRWSHIPVIMLTAKQTDHDIIGGLKLGADDYITKPFNIEHLQLRIDKFMEWTRQSHEAFHRKIEVNPSEITITSLDEEFVERAVKLVESHMADSDYSVENFSSDLNMSRANLYKKMMSIVGMGPHDFMRSIRLKRAHQLLERSQKQVSEIAYAVGYSSPKRFSENFKAEYGMTPTEFVKQCKSAV